MKIVSEEEELVKLGISERWDNEELKLAYIIGNDERILQFIPPLRELIGISKDGLDIFSFKTTEMSKIKLDKLRLAINILQEQYSNNILLKYERTILSMLIGNVLIPPESPVKISYDGDHVTIQVSRYISRTKLRDRYINGNKQLEKYLNKLPKVPVANNKTLDSLLLDEKKAKLKDKHKGKDFEDQLSKNFQYYEYGGYKNELNKVNSYNDLLKMLYNADVQNQKLSPTEQVLRRDIFNTIFKKSTS